MDGHTPVRVSCWRVTEFDPTSNLFHVFFVSSCFSLKRKVGVPIFTPTKAVKTGAGLSVVASTHLLAWVDAAC